MRLADRAWAGFRSLPWWAQTGLWVVAAPALAAFLILRRDPSAALNRVAAAVVLVVGGAVWLGAGGGEPANEPVAAGAADAPAEAPRGEPAGADAAAGTGSPAPAVHSPSSSPRPSPSPQPAPSPAPVVVATTWTVTDVIDGDTVDVRSSNGTTERVRIIGIDTPEQGECGYGEAYAVLAELVDGRAVQLVAGASDDRDRYDRILRYVDVDGTDAGLELLHRGLAIARYDSRDGYGAHPRERAYVAADAAAADVTCGAPPPPPADPAPASGGDCDPSYPTVCIPPAPPDLDCGDIPHRRFPVHPPDPHGFDGNDDDGVGCES